MTLESFAATPHAPSGPPGERDPERGKGKKGQRRRPVAASGRRASNSKNSKKIIRLKRLNNKYSKIELNIKIEEYNKLIDIPIN